jgi:hypothetical protein
MRTGSAAACRALSRRLDAEVLIAHRDVEDIKQTAGVNLAVESHRTERRQSDGTAAGHARKHSGNSGRAALRFHVVALLRADTTCAARLETP